MKNKNKSLGEDILLTIVAVFAVAWTIVMMLGSIAIPIITIALAGDLIGLWDVVPWF